MIYLADSLSSIPKIRPVNPTTCPFKSKIGKRGKDKIKRLNPGGFFTNREMAKIAGSKGGKISKRKPA